MNRNSPNSASADKGKRAPSVARNRPGFTVPASPFNGVKLELGLILALCLPVWLLADRLSVEPLLQVALLALFGVAAALWIGWRVRRVVHRVERGEGCDGAQ